MTVAEFLSRLEGVRGKSARCPAHEDRQSSLSVTSGADGRVLLKCHAGCTPEEVLAAMDLGWADLFPPKVEEKLPWRRVATYPYVDEKGVLLYEVVRFERGEGGARQKTFRQRKPSGEWNAAGVRRVPFRLPALKGAETVLVVEGEKDVLTAEALGFVATTNSGGAGGWEVGFGQFLGGRTVVVCPDDDEPGEKWAVAVAASLSSPPRVLRFPGAKDLTEWVEAGGTAAELGALVSGAPRWSSWNWAAWSGLRRLPGAPAWLSALGTLVGADPAGDSSRPLLVPLWDGDGECVGAVRTDAEGRTDPLRVAGAGVGVACWAVNRVGGLGAVLTEASGGVLRLCRAPVPVLRSAEPAAMPSGSRAYGELVVRIEAAAHWARPAKVVLCWGEEVWPATTQRLSSLGLEVTRESGPKVPSQGGAGMWALSEGGVAWASLDADGRAKWRICAAGPAKNLLVSKGWSPAEARSAVSALPLAVGFVFDPRTRDMTLREGSEWVLNEWRGMPDTKPVVGPWPVLRGLVEHLTCGDAGGAEWLLDWLAAPLQSLHAGRGGLRCRTAPVFHGTQGTGKGWLVELLRVLYGEWCLEIGQGQVADSFDVVRFRSCLMLICNEVEAKPAHMSRMKMWVTEETMQIRKMREAAVETAIRFNIMFTSNAARAVAVEEGDRRFSVWRQSRALDADSVAALRVQKASGWPEAPRMLAALLERRVVRDLWVPWVTTAKTDLMQAGMDGGQAFVHALAADGLTAVARAWAMSVLEERKRAGLEPRPPVVQERGFALLTTLSRVMQTWCKEHNADCRGVNAMRLRTLLLERFPEAVWRRGVVAGYGGFGAEGLPQGANGTGWSVLTPRAVPVGSEGEEGEEVAA